jgi:hypothetical protein
VYDGTINNLSKQQSAATIDPIGGKPLASLLSKIQYGGSVAVSGLTAGELCLQLYIPDKDTFSTAFKDMITPIQRKLEELDKDIHFPMIHTTRGASFLVALVDGLVIQYYVGIFEIDQLKEMSPHLTSIILNGFKAKPY